MWLYRKTNGRVGAILPGSGAPVCLFTTTGRTSRMAHTIPLVYLAAGERVAVVARPRAGGRRPDWYVNVVADPRVTVDIDGDARAMLARPASAADTAALWPRLVEMYPKYEAYRPDVGGDPAVVICTLGS